MVTRLLLFAALLLALASVANAGPKRVLGKTFDFLDKHHVEFDFTVGASSGAFTASGYDCRHRVGPEGCLAGYGSIRGIGIANFGLTLAAIGLSEYGRKQHFKEWFLPATLALGANTAFAVHEFRIKPKR